MSRTALRDRLAARRVCAAPPALLCVTGASGAGKTAAAAAVREHIEARLLPILEFDSLGVPSPEEMQLGWETPRGWQKAMTWFWVRTAKTVHRTRPLVLLEGQFDPQYAVAACAANGLPRPQIAVLHADAETLRARVTARGQPELAGDDQARWSVYLRDATRDLGGVIVDASRGLAEVADELCALALRLVPG